MADLAGATGIDSGELRDGDLTLRFDRLAPHQVHKVPTYHFQMIHSVTGAELGHINLRIGNSTHIERYAGHVGFAVHPGHRGQRYAARSLRLLLRLASKLGINPLWITCDPENRASRRTLELAGAEFVEVVDVPPDCVIFQNGKVAKCRYRLPSC
jgi:predicted acetyltransferase